jgi:multiple sugar transport system substrate-binding protein
MLVRRRQGWSWQLVLPALCCALASCGRTGSAPTTPAQPHRGVSVTVGALGDDSRGLLETVAAQRGEWAASQAAEVVIKGPVDPGSLQGVDVLIFPAQRLGDLVDAGALAVLPEALVLPPAAKKADEAAGDSLDSAPARSGSREEADPLRFAEIAPAFRDLVVKYGSDRMAFPYGGSALVLVYDRAAFASEANRGAAREKELELKPPRTWEQLDALARFFEGRDWDGDGAVDHGIALALGSDPGFLGESIFLARAASLGQHREHYSFLFNKETMAPRINTPPFVAALAGLVALKACGPPGMESFDAEAARRAFREGKTALLIDRAEMAASWSHGRASIGVAPLPGSERVFDPARKQWEETKPGNHPSYLPFGGGWLVGVNRAAVGRQREAAIDFARYLISPDTANRVRADRGFPMLPVRSALLSQGPPDLRAAMGVDARQWSDAVSQCLITRRVIPGLRIPQADGYLADLSRKRIAALRDAPEPAEAALEEVARAWISRTEALGTARQKWHYQRTLNVLVTAPEPPPR